MAILKGFLVKNGIEHEFLEKKSTHHAEEASQASGIPLDNIVKTLVFLDENSEPVIAIILAKDHASRHKLQEVSERKSLSLAEPEQAYKITGYPTGGIPPVGHKKPLPVFMDKGVLGLDYAWAGGGCRTQLVRLPVKDIVRINNPKIGDLVV